MRTQLREKLTVDHLRTVVEISPLNGHKKPLIDAGLAGGGRVFNLWNEPSLAKGRDNSSDIGIQGKS